MHTPRLALRHAFIALAAVALFGACTVATTASPGTPASASPQGSLLPSPASPAPSDESSPAPPSATAAPSGPAALAWAPLSVSGPGPAGREDHTWTLDPDTRVAYLFGGRDRGTVFDDLWRFDLETDTWLAIEPEGPRPEARFGHTGTWVEGVGLVVWSGQRGSTFFDDLWAYDPGTNRWRELPTNGPVPAARYGSCAALGPDGRLWISHGFTADSGRFDDTQAYDFAAGRWTDETADGLVAPIRCLHDCLWTPDGRLVIYAGQTTGTPAIGDLWSRGTTGEWTSISDGPPPARQLYALAAIDGTAYVFGGGAKDGGTLRDLWTLDLATLAWTEASPSGDRPSGRSGSTLVADPAGSRLLLFGGLREGVALDDAWQLSIGG
ncbi:MAG TPA: kelch repeat-containing protein [Candidatus Limnocylindrales bacterium]|nr:kelch repeat-containing protein [Candidatus Limnocylindrales bacterium]HEU4918492.1 kelch repeat-containing protein [Candidatus Limnocylindrales bacterium]